MSLLFGRAPKSLLCFCFRCAANDGAGRQTAIRRQSCRCDFGTRCEEGFLQEISIRTFSSRIKFVGGAVDFLFKFVILLVYVLAGVFFEEFQSV